MSIYVTKFKNPCFKVKNSGGIKGGMGALSEALSPLPPSQKEKMAKTSYFWHFKKILPPQICICPLDAPHEKFSGAATGQKTTKLGFSGTLNSVFIKNEIDHKLKPKKKKKKKKDNCLVVLHNVF